MTKMDHYQQNPQSVPIEYIYCPFVGCKKAFLYKSEIERHMITHKNSKPHVCPFDDCEKSFKRQDALRVHLQSHSEEPQFFCSIPGCQAKYKSKPALKYHLSKHHISELKSMSSSSPELASTPSIKIKPRRSSEKALSSSRKSFDSLSRECEEEIEPEPTKFLFKEGGETKPDSLKRTVRQEMLKYADDEELRELKFFCSRLMRENRELKNQLADQMMSFHGNSDSHLYGNFSFE